MNAVEESASNPIKSNSMFLCWGLKTFVKNTSSHFRQTNYQITTQRKGVGKRKQIDLTSAVLYYLFLIICQPPHRPNPPQKKKLNTYSRIIKDLLTTDHLVLQTRAHQLDFLPHPFRTIWSSKGKLVDFGL
jgi:hypothetical protein